jgi:hypothetical protein
VPAARAVGFDLTVADEEECRCHAHAANDVAWIVAAGADQT